MKSKIFLITALLIVALVVFSGCTQQHQTAPLDNNSPANIQPAPGPDSTPEAAPELEPPKNPVTDNNQPAPNTSLSKVTKVIDGDTIEISTGDKVRFVCINTPEKGQPGFQEAKDYLTGLILNKSVRLEKDVSEIDRYGRLLRYVYLGDVFVNGELVEKGYAELYRYPPDIALCDELEALEATAKTQKIGLWATQETPAGTEQYICSRNAYNCTDFTTRAQAQAAYDTCGGKANDIHKLDSDLDGIACESLP